MDIVAALERIFNHIENGDVDKAVRACLRVSRNIKDYFHTAVFLCDLINDKKEITRVLLDDTSHLKEESQKHLLKTSFEYWLDARTFEHTLGTPKSNGEKTVLVTSVGEFHTELEQLERSITDLTLPSTMGEYDSAAFTDRYNEVKAQLRLRINTINAIKSRILNRCLNFAIQVERQFDAQRKTTSFLEEAQNQVQNYFKVRSPDVYEKLQKANQLIESNNAEDLSLMLTQVRRAIKSVADYFYPPVVTNVVCSDGTERKLGDEQYLNRLQEFLATQVTNSSSSDLLRAELEHLLFFARKLNSIASKGVHSDVSLSEAKQGFLGLYMFLYNICNRLEERTPNPVFERTAPA